MLPRCVRPTRPKDAYWMNCSITLYWNNSLDIFHSWISAGHEFILTKRYIQGNTLTLSAVTSMLNVSDNYKTVSHITLCIVIEFDYYEVLQTYRAFRDAIYITEKYRRRLYEMWFFIEGNMLPNKLKKAMHISYTQTTLKVNLIAHISLNTLPFVWFHKYVCYILIYVFWFTGNINSLQRNLSELRRLCIFHPSMHGED